MLMGPHLSHYWQVRGKRPGLVRELAALATADAEGARRRELQAAVGAVAPLMTYRRVGEGCAARATPCDAFEMLALYVHALVAERRWKLD